MNKNEIYTGIVSAYGSDGEGIIKQEGYTIFLPFAIPGEKVRFKVLKVQKNLVFAKIQEVLTPAEERVRPKCSVFGKCGGCQLMHLSYNEQLSFKRDSIANCFKKIAFLEVNPKRTVPSTPELGYRSKLQLPIRQTDSGVKIGFFAVNSHRVVDVNNCVIHGEWSEKIITALRKYITAKKISAYNELTGEGLLRHLVVKKIGCKFIIILVVNGETLPSVNYFNDLLKVALGVDYSIFINVNTRNDNVILGEKYLNLFGDSLVSDSFYGLNYSVGPASFMQVNENVKAKLYSKVVEIAGDNDTVIDAYCGAGLLSCLLARKAKKVIGIEVVEEAVKCAKNMASENAVSNAKFYCGECEKLLPTIIKENKNALLVLDPPRKGLDKNLALAVCEAKPKRIIYVSCSPQTLARDVGIITGTLKYENNQLVKSVPNAINCEQTPILPNGYKIEYLRGYDMFAQCKGVESICVLTRE